jgi:hypothetical protein
MSTQYPGGFITKSPVAPTTTAASGIWTVDQALQYQKAGTWPLPPSPYIEDLFSTYLYTGNGATQTITNNINTSARGGLVWIKSRSDGTLDHKLTDTARGAGNALSSNLSSAQVTDTDVLSAFGSTSFAIGGNVSVNASAGTYASWTFAKQTKFFDIVTWTGTGSARTIAHNLGSVPGCIIVKCSSNTFINWSVYHRGLTSAAYNIQLNTTAAQASSPTVWNSTAPTSTEFSIGTDATVNFSSYTYVAYLFAHNAGGFGLTGTDNVISCGTYTGNGTTQEINLGYEPQFLLTKMTNNTGSESATQQSWRMVDIMRGMPVANDDALLLANTTGAENSSIDSYCYSPTATGFTVLSQANQSGKTFIYVAIRRGPMKTPTDATTVFAAQNNRNGPGSATAPSFVSNFPIDMFMRGYKPGASASFQWLDDRLRQAYLVTSATDAEAAIAWKFDSQTGVYFQSLASSTSEVGWMFKRAPGFMDVVCYSGAASPNPYLVSHNLGASPELIIIKARNNTINWYVWGLPLGIPGAPAGNMFLNLTNASATTEDQIKSVSSTTFGLKPNENYTSGAGYNYVAYLFATLAGVSKVGSYTGTAATQTISCGFSGGARFVMIKRINSTGDWYVWDTARGMVAGTDPSLSLNSTAAESNVNWVYSTTGGFQIVTSNAGVNASGGTYIFLAIA